MDCNSIEDLPEEVLDIVMYYLDEEDLNNLTSEEIGSERIKNRANRALERLKMLEDLKEKWLENAIDGNLKEMKAIYQGLRSKGFLQEVKNFKDSSERNALIWATWKGHLDISKFLVRKDLVDVNSKDDHGSNALHYAAYKNRPEIAKWLLEETAIGVNDQNIYGRTALHIGAYFNFLEVTRILLKYKPRLLRNYDGETPLDVAIRQRDEGDSEDEDDRVINEEIIELLTTHFDI